MAVTKDIRRDRAEIFVRASAGESLLFRIIAQGSPPTFELTDTGAEESLLSQQDDEVEPGVWEHRWPQPGGPARPTICVMTLIFPNTITYTYQVEHSARGMIIDIDFEASGRELAIRRALEIDAL